MDGTCDRETRLLARLASGDERALALAFSRHRERLWQMARFRLNGCLAGRVDEEDVLQEAYLNAATRLKQIPDSDVSSVFLWLRRIVAQTLIDVHRRHDRAAKRSVRREVPMRAFSPQATSGSIARQLVGRLTSPSNAMMRVELADHLEKALAEMDPIDREVLALRHFEELTNSEVADVLGIQHKAASIRYVRALDRLKKLLARVPGLVPDA